MQKNIPVVKTQRNASQLRTHNKRLQRFF